MKIAVIPARGGSKRIPRKNIKLFAGKPIIAHSIEAALESGLFDRVLVSTDDPEIAEVAKGFGAEVPFLRPKELSDDHTGTSAVVRHALQWALGEGLPVQYVCCIYATAPFVQAATLKKAFALLVEAGKEYAFAVTSFPFPILRSIRLTEDGGVEPIWPEHVPKRSQDLEEAYHDAGQFYWGRAEAFLKGTPVFSRSSVPVILPRYLVQDIDTPEDWQRAELMYQAVLATRG
jgi:N-acylneuraminate cytidylyltransferase